MLERMFVDTSSRAYYLTTDVLSFFTILSIIGLVLETVPGLQSYSFYFLVIEWAAVFVFSGEYIARVIVTKPWYRYSCSFFGVIDLVAVLPTIFGLGNLTFLKSARILRIMRFLRMVRLAKLSRVSMKDIEDSYGMFALNIGIYLTLLISALLLFGTALFLVEVDVSAFASIPHAMWWTFKVFLGSLPVDAPISIAGGVLYVFARFFGLVLLGVLVGVVGNIFRAFLLGNK